MSINRDFIGRKFKYETRYQVGREKVREFAIAIGDMNPAYHDVDYALSLGHPDLVAPPTFVFAVTFKAMGATLANPDLNLNYAMVVHGEQQFAYERPLFANDEVLVHSTIEDIRAAGRNEMLAMRQDVTTVDGELIVVTRNVTVSRGTAPETEA